MNGRRRQMRRVHVQCGPKKKKKKKKKALFLINSCTADSGCALVNTELQFHQGR